MAIVVVTVVLATLLPGLSSAATSVEASRTVKVVLAVEGCSGCAITPVQNLRGSITYQGRARKPVNGTVVFQIPLARARSLAFLVDAPFRTVHGPLGSDFPAVVVTQFRGKRPGAVVKPGDTVGRRSVSGCIDGLRPGTHTNTIVIRRVKVDQQPRVSAYLRRTVRSAPPWVRVKDASRHVSDPSICR